MESLLARTLDERVIWVQSPACGDLLLWRNASRLKFCFSFLLRTWLVAGLELTINLRISSPYVKVQGILRRSYFEAFQRTHWNISGRTNCHRLNRIFLDCIFALAKLHRRLMASSTRRAFLGLAQFVRGDNDGCTGGQAHHDSYCPHQVCTLKLYIRLIDLIMQCLACSCKNNRYTTSKLNLSYSLEF